MTKVELGIVGDFLAGSFCTTPSPPPLRGEEGEGQRPEHFSDPAAHATVDLIIDIFGQTVCDNVPGALRAAVPGATIVCCGSVSQTSEIAAGGR